jgi:hypothetical protein
MGNNRGNGYSMANTKYPPSQSEFWDFSWGTIHTPYPIDIFVDDMAEYDFPSQIKYILHATKQPKLAYVGYVSTRLVKQS